jgi:3-hydroxy-D-aspartate aldolase
MSVVTKDHLGPNAGLIDMPGSRWNLNTPALVLEIDALDRNICAMAAHAERCGLQLRPHCKVHKSIAIARRQMEAGAIGICCATLGEAETMVAGGITGVLITSPIVSSPMIHRLMTLNATAEGLMVVTDNALNLSALNKAALSWGKRLGVIVDFDVGQERTGALTSEAVLNLARQASESHHLRFLGIQAYYGHLQHICSFEERSASANVQMTRLKKLSEELAEAGMPPQLVTGGGTGTFDIDPSGGVYTELQPGSYLFLDREYTEIALSKAGPRFEPSLFVQATVISANRLGEAIINAGYKSFATEGGKPILRHPSLASAVYDFMGDEHGRIRYQVNSGPALALGETVEFLTPHCDPTINLYDRYHCVRGEDLVDIWAVDARGR